MNVFLADEAATDLVAQRLAAALPTTIDGLTILLQGELGAGKSTFARALLRALGHSGTVPSPSYTLIEPYRLARGDVYHIDLYRIADEEELYFLGFDELEAGLRLIEWPERAPSLLASADLLLEFSYQGTGRRLQITPSGEQMDHLVAGLMLDPKT